MVFKPELVPPSNFTVCERSSSFARRRRSAVAQQRRHRPDRQSSPDALVAVFDVCSCSSSARARCKMLAPHRTGSTFHFSNTLGIVQCGPYIADFFELCARHLKNLARISVFQCVPAVTSRKNGLFSAVVSADIASTCDPSFWVLKEAQFEKPRAMSGGHCPPFEDHGHRNKSDFRVPAAAAAAAANWLRTTYQIDNNAAGKK